MSSRADNGCNVTLLCGWGQPRLHGLPVATGLWPVRVEARRSTRIRRLTEPWLQHWDDTEVISPTDNSIEECFDQRTFFGEELFGLNLRDSSFGVLWGVTFLIADRSGKTRISELCLTSGDICLLRFQFDAQHASLEKRNERFITISANTPRSGRRG